MDRTLLILRHGKSRHSLEYSSDFERPLSPRGEKAAVLMARHMLMLGINPQLIVTSPAARALGTALLVRDELNGVSLRKDENLYGADVDDFYNVLEQVNDDVHPVLIVAHNPGLELFIDDLTGTCDNVLKTCSLAVLSCPCESWSKLAEYRCKLVAVYHPRELANQTEA